MTDRDKIAVLLRMHKDKCREYSKSIQCDTAIQCDMAIQCDTARTRRLGDEVQALWWAIEAVAHEYPGLHVNTGNEATEGHYTKGDYTKGKDN